MKTNKVIKPDPFNLNERKTAKIAKGAILEGATRHKTHKSLRKAGNLLRLIFLIVEIGAILTLIFFIVPNIIFTFLSISYYVGFDLINTLLLVSFIIGLSQLFKIK